MGLRRWLIMLVCLAWAAAIFMISGTSFSPETIFAWLHEHVFLEDVSFQTFRRLWFAYWGYVSKGLHFLAFVILMVLCTLGIDRLWGRRLWRSLFIAAALCLAYAASDEWHQAFVPRRSAELADFFTDALGIATAGIFLSFFRRTRQK